MSCSHMKSGTRNRPRENTERNERGFRDMFWDKISPLYDLFENVYNHKVYAGTGKKVAEFIESTDDVLECACGTGAISVSIA